MLPGGSNAPPQMNNQPGDMGGPSGDLPYHHHMSNQQPISKKLRPKNYSLSKGSGLGMTAGESVPSSQSTTFRNYQ